MILVGGIHGVGKTYFCEKLSKQLNIEHYSSSILISLKKEQNFSTNKKVKDISNNQTLLLEAVSDLNKQTNFILDGHFCLLNKNGEIEKIPKDTFIKLSPSAVLLLIDTIDSILLKLYKRDNKYYKRKLINEFQNTEISYAKEITTTLNIPFLIHHVNNSSAILKKFIIEQF